MESRQSYKALKVSSVVGTAAGSLLLSAFIPFPLAAVIGFGSYVYLNNQYSEGVVKQYIDQIGNDVGDSVNRKIRANNGGPMDNKFMNQAYKSIAVPMIDNITKNLGKSVSTVLDELDTGALPHETVTQYYPPRKNQMTLSPSLLTKTHIVVQMADAMRLSGPENKKMIIDNFNIVDQVEASITKYLPVLGLFGKSREIAEQVVQQLENKHVLTVG